MRYLLLIMHNERDWIATSAKKKELVYGQYRALISSLAASKELVYADQFMPSASALEVRTDGATNSISTHAVQAQPAGFMLIDVADAASAVAIATRIPNVCGRTVEVWPISPRV